MTNDVVVEMMSNEFVLWRCLHGGPLTRETITQPGWEQLRARNVPLLAKLTEVYGSCAVVAMDGNRIVGQLRFYPKVVCDMAAPGPALCLQEQFPSGPANDLADKEFPPLNRIADKTIFVHCMMTGSCHQEDNPYQRRGIGSQMVRTLVDWARLHGWAALEAHAYADLPCWYAGTGQAGGAFWEKLGFHVTQSTIEPAFAAGSHERFVSILLKEAADRGMDAETAKTRHTMRLNLA